MTESGNIQSVKNSCYKILESMYGNIIEFDCGERNMCFKKLNDDIEHSSLSTVKLVSEDITGFFVTTFIDEKSRGMMLEMLESVNRKSELYSDVTFDFKSGNGSVTPCCGRIFCDGKYCWICFEKMDGYSHENSVCTADADKTVYIRTNGFFDVYVNGTAVLFHSQKAKELLEFIVEHAGGYVTSRDAAKHLWPDEPADQKILSRCRKAAMLLHQTLEEYGIEEIVENRCGKRRIVKEKVECDLFNH